MHDATPELNTALAAFQAELPRVTKGELANITRKDGTPGPKYRYADLADVTQAAMPLLARHGLAFTAFAEVRDGLFGLAYTLRHTSGETATGFYLLPSPVTTTPQQVGSAITYARRYALCAATGIAPDGDDDDGASAQDAHANPFDADATKGSSWQAPANPSTRKATRTRGPLPDDQWTTAPPDGSGPESQPGSSTPDQHRNIAIRLQERGLTTRADKLGFCSEITGAQVGSSKELSYADAEKILKAAS